MDLSHDKVELSFSIEKILRDDFSHSRREKVVDLPMREANFPECWPTFPVHRCYAPPYNTVFMKYLPATNRVNAGVTLHRVSGENEHFLAEQTKISDDDCLSCKDEESQRDGKTVVMKIILPIHFT